MTKYQENELEKSDGIVSTSSASTINNLQSSTAATTQSSSQNSAPCEMYYRHHRTESECERNGTYYSQNWDVFDAVDRLPPLDLPNNEHHLQHTYCYWFSDKNSKDSYKQRLKLIGRFGTVEQFWRIYSLVSPDHLRFSDLHLFKNGVRPTWEHNIDGGHWRIRLRKGLAARCWENLVLAVLGEQLMVGEEICGAVLKIRTTEDLMSLWNNSHADLSVLNRIRERFRQVLFLPPSTVIEYKPHREMVREKYIVNGLNDSPHDPRSGGNIIKPSMKGETPFESNGHDDQDDDDRPHFDTPCVS